MPGHVATARRPSRLGLAQGGNRYRQSRKGNKPARPAFQWGKFGRWFTIGVYVFVGISFFLAVSLGLLAAYRWMTRSNSFGLEQIQVQGNAYLKYEDVLNAAGLELGQNAFGLNMKQIERNLRGLPWVKGVTLKRELPDTLSITLVEREPRYWRQQGEKLFFADKDGEIIAPVETGHFKALPVLHLEEGAQDALEVLQAFGTRARALHSPFDPRQAAWIRVKNDGDIELYFESRDLLVSLDSREWELNLDCLRRAWADLVRRGEHNSVHAMAAYGAKVWITRS